MADDFDAASNARTSSRVDDDLEEIFGSGKPPASTTPDSAGSYSSVTDSGDGASAPGSPPPILDKEAAEAAAAGAPPLFTPWNGKQGGVEYMRALGAELNGKASLSTEDLDAAEVTMNTMLDTRRGEIARSNIFSRTRVARFDRTAGREADNVRRTIAMARFALSIDGVDSATQADVALARKVFDFSDEMTGIVPGAMFMPNDYKKKMFAVFKQAPAVFEAYKQLFNRVVSVRAEGRAGETTENLVELNDDLIQIGVGAMMHEAALSENVGILTSPEVQLVTGVIPKALLDLALPLNTQFSDDSLAHLTRDLGGPVGTATVRFDGENKAGTALRASLAGDRDLEAGAGEMLARTVTAERRAGLGAAVFAEHASDPFLGKKTHSGWSIEKAKGLGGEGMFYATRTIGMAFGDRARVDKVTLNFGSLGSLDKEQKIALSQAYEAVAKSMPLMEGDEASREALHEAFNDKAEAALKAAGLKPGQIGRAATIIVNHVMETHERMDDMRRYVMRTE